jgi:mannose-6-phosphate isomerase-like protein (cupin superfamily)
VRVFGEGELEAADVWLRGLDEEAGSPVEKINLAQKLGLFSGHWSPRIVGQVNDCQIKLVKMQGAFDWHHHEAEDEAFLVIAGRFRMEFRDRAVSLDAGEMIVVPRGVEHRPVADEEAHVLLFEPGTTRNTGNLRSERTVDAPERV